ncbi:MAG: circadian clock protein KaiC [Chthoniobacteraceae bacterium]|nr:circadian clock protein KaiC [Chthoniobacteraceae bacterium]
MPTTKKQNSPIPKCLTGISGFDDITNGGLPRGRATLLMGGTGSGKTVFALQTLVNGARTSREPGIFVAFEEGADRINANAASFNWNARELGENQLFIFDARVRPDVVKAGEFDLKGMLAGIKDKVTTMKAKRIVFDSLDVLLNLLENPALERREVYRLFDWLVENELTGIITMKLEAGQPAAGSYAFMQFHSECVVQLGRRQVNRFSLRELQVLKYRGSSHSDDQTPFVILSSGIEVASNSPSELEHEASTERVPTGIAQLDEMLGGGYFRGNSALITGAPGTAKSILSGAFIEAACRRGERTLYITFDENASEVERNLSSVSIEIGSYHRSGLLRFFVARTEAASGPVHLMKIKLLIEEFKPRCVVVDPVSALIRAGDVETAETIVERLLYNTQAKGITTICTSIVEDTATLLGTTPIYVTTITDTWIHVSYFIQSGERNRSLSIVKSRGMGHSNRICELILSDNGVALNDVYVSQGEVVMGSLRWSRQLEEQAEHRQVKAEIEKMQREIDKAKAELPAQVDSLERQLNIKQAKLNELIAAQNAQEASRTRQLKPETGHTKSEMPSKGHKSTSGKTTGPRRHGKGEAQ